MKLKIQNFAKIKDADIILDGITVIAGKNNTGKSTVGKILDSMYNSTNNLETKMRRARKLRFRNVLSSKLNYAGNSVHLSPAFIAETVDNIFESDDDNEVANILAPLADKKGITIVKNLKADFEVYADYQKVQQILYNLVSNAIKFTPKNGQVDILATCNDKSFKLVVHDNGIGIDEKYHGKIFAKFVQLDSAYTKKESSTGLGLTITKELVELHGGKISVVSEVNNGSTFIVEIPVVNA